MASSLTVRPGRLREGRDVVTTGDETIALRLGGLGLSHGMAPSLLCDLGCDVSPLHLTSPAFEQALF